MLTALTLSFLPLIGIFYVLIYFRFDGLATFTIGLMVFWLLIMPFMLIFINELKDGKQKEAQKKDEQT